MENILIDNTPGPVILPGHGRREGKMKKEQIKAMIKFRMDETHPDRYCVNGWTPEKELTFTDIYYVDEITDGVIEYIKNELKLIAGGGYNTDHIHNVKFTFENL